MPAEPGVRILVVDDEVAQRKALCDTLRDHGYDTIGCATGEAALAALREARFALLLSDLMMPGMDGVTLLRAAFGVDPSLVGVIMTGHGTVDTAVEAMKSGALDYIVKPFKLSVVLPVIARALGVRRLRLENAELQRQIRDRTSELEASNQDLEAFSYSVSHDLRAPLRAIDGFSRTLVGEHAALLPDDARRLLDKVTSGAQRMGQMIDDLLRLSRAGKQQLSRRPVDLSLLVGSVVDGLRKEHAGREIEVHLGDLPIAVGDAALVEQILVNLLANAFKFTRGEPQARIEIDSRREAEETIYFVRDNGAGFDPRYAARLFGPFQRLHRAEEFEGTGVGLAIVQRIIQKHGGRVWAEGKENEGATFYFALPKE